MFFGYRTRGLFVLFVFYLFQALERQGKKSNEAYVPA